MAERLPTCDSCAVAAADVVRYSLVHRRVKPGGGIADRGVGGILLCPDCRASCGRRCDICGSNSRTSAVKTFRLSRHVGSRRDGSLRRNVYHGTISLCALCWRRHVAPRRRVLRRSAANA